MSRKIAVFGGSFNPPANHHVAIVRELSAMFDKVIVVPCGPRPDKATTNDIEPVHRAAMADMAFRGIPNVEIDLFDLEQASFTRTHELESRYAAREQGSLWHVVGYDLVTGGKDDGAQIQSKWLNGRDLWADCRFAVVPRAGYAVDEADLPPKCLLLPPVASGSSSDIRTLVFQHKPFRELVPAEVAAYIERYNLYRGGLPVGVTRLSLGDPMAMLVLDERNPRAIELAARLSGFGATEAEANCIIAIGGDGTMLRAIRRHWRKRLPFVGINAGHKGWLLNDVSELADPGYLFDDLRSHLLPQLYVEFVREDGSLESRYAFNDAWVERSSSQCAWLEVCRDDRTAIPKLVGDGILACTAAGSTGYARAMGATPLIDHADHCLLVGNNVMQPWAWKAAPFSLRTTIDVRSLDPAKRPIRGFTDGKEAGIVRSMRARVSRIASVELAFSSSQDRATKLAHELFPK